MTYIRVTGRFIFSHIGVSWHVSRDLHLVRLSSYTHKMATQLERPAAAFIDILKSVLRCKYPLLVHHVNNN